MSAQDESIICSLCNTSSVSTDGEQPVPELGYISRSGCHPSRHEPAEHDLPPGTAQWRERPTCVST